MTAHYELGDALLGERIAVRARTIDNVKIKKGSSRHSHRIQATTLRDSAYCVIEKPLRTDIKEQIRLGTSVCVVLTEDEITAPLKAILESSGFDMERTNVKSYFGCTSPHNLHPLIQTIKEVNQNAVIIVHKDRDYYTDLELTNWQTEIRSMGAKPFVTKGVDIESHFLDNQHLAAVNQNLSEDLIEDLIARAMTDTRQDSISHYVNGRCDIEKKAGTFGQLNLGNLAAQAPDVYDSDPLKYCHSKTVISKMRQLFRAEYSANLESQKRSDFISSPVLSEIARRTFPQQPTLSSL